MSPALSSSSKASFRLRPSILLFGDSITQFGFGNPPDTAYGWASQLSAAYTRRADVLNRGFSGYNTRHALELLPRLFRDDSKKDDLLFATIFFGANDAALPGEGQHVPIDEYEANLEQLVVQIRERCCSSDNSSSTPPLPIVLLTPPPVDEVKLTAWKGSSNRDNQNTRQYGLKVQQVADRHDQVSVVDCWKLLQGDSDRRGDHVCDGLHLNTSGNQRVFDGLMSVIQTDFPHLAPMSDDDGEGRYGKSGIPVEEKLWRELV